MIKDDVIDVNEIVENQRKLFNTLKTFDVSFRKRQLRILRKLLIKHQKELFQALKEDLSKSEYEVFGSEIGQVLDEISFALSHLRVWSARERVSSSWISFPSRHYIYPVPRGIVYIIGAWNYPILLTLAPLVGAIAAGNCVIIKPSELSKNTSKVIYDLIQKYFDESYIKVVEGGPEVSERILNEDLDYIFFTGSPRVGKIIMKAAAERLIPVTLELGGKSPCIVDEDSNLEISARRVLFGKMLNAGQTCVAPDFLLVHQKIKDKFLEILKTRIIEIYGEQPELHEDVCKIINKDHYNRLKEYLYENEVFFGGNTDDDNLKIAPTILTNITWEDKVMKEEIFGPVLPVLEFSDLDQAIKVLNEKGRPLAAYYFSSNRKKQNKVIQELHFGGGVINDTLFHFGNPELPVGGIGTSGIGSYHGKFSFDTFSHKKSIIKKPYYLDISLRYPPYKGKLKFLKWLFRF